MVADARWAAMSIAPSSAGLEVRGRVHTVTEAAARVVLDAEDAPDFEALKLLANGTDIEILTWLDDHAR